MSKPACWLQLPEKCECCHIPDKKKQSIYSNQIIINLHFEGQKGVSVQINGDCDKESMQMQHQFRY